MSRHVIGDGWYIGEFVCLRLVAEYWREDGCCIIFVLPNHESIGQ